MNPILETPFITKKTVVPHPQKQKVFFPNLDALRFFAFFGVFVSHTFRHWNFPQDTVLNKILFVFPTLNDQSGPLGVRFFFVLSGFLITYLIFIEKEKNQERFKLKAFYARRFLRIWPLYFVAILIGFVIYPIAENFFTGTTYNENANIINYLFFSGNFDMLSNGNPQGIPLGLLWSLAVEEQFYLFWPLIFMFLRPAKKLRYLVTFCLLLIASLWFQLVYREDKWVNYFHSFSCMSSLVTGGILAYFSLYNKRFVSLVQQFTTLFILFAYFIGFLLIYTIFYFTTPTINVFYYLALNIFFAFIILEQNVSSKSFFKFGRLRIMSYLGKVSFGLYILHPVGIYITDLLLPGSGFSHISFASKFLLALGLSIGLGYISYNYFETYFLKLKVKFEN
jgi:peptidoglycan/LPS O-acetylase OafA/YrhL